MFAKCNGVVACSNIGEGVQEATPEKDNRDVQRMCIVAR